MKKYVFLIALIIVIQSCNEKATSFESMSKMEVWKLGWRMIENSMEDNLSTAENQFDSLLNQTSIIDIDFLVSGLEILGQLDKQDKLIKVLETQSKTVIQEVCERGLLIQQFKELPPCKDLPKERISNPALQLELVKMLINDQYVRGNYLEDLLNKYELKKSEVIQDLSGVDTDEYNRIRLKEIIEKYGFPTKELVGKDGMSAVFFIIQHSGGDKTWQKEQLINIKKAVELGDMKRQDYAYLYDRVKMLNGEKQLFGTQFSEVNPQTKIVTLAEVEDLENLDKRRMETGLMPIEMYKRIMLKNL